VFSSFDPGALLARYYVLLRGLEQLLAEAFVGRAQALVRARAA
jgi:hypothetical protein